MGDGEEDTQRPHPLQVDAAKIAEARAKKGETITTRQVMMKFLTQTRGPLVPQTLNLRHLQENLEVIQSRNLSAPVLAKIAAKVANSRLNRIEL
jgi:diketogulonate reductase-like aldo/keto reductase